MKKIITLFLALLLVVSVAACGGKKEEEPSPQSQETVFEWTRTGYFVDEEENVVVIAPSDDEDMPGWSVSCYLDDEVYGGVIQLEGKTLHGNLALPDVDEKDYVVTVSEEGEDGIAVAVEGGKTYHLKKYEIPVAAFAVSVNTEGWGQIAYAKGTDTPEFEDDFPSQSAYIGLAEAETYTFAAKPDEGWKFLKWTLNGAEYSKDAQITLEITGDTELVAVFGIAGTDETPVDLKSVKTLGELFGLPNYGTMCSENKFVLAFEQDGNIYQAIADVPDDVREALFALDWDDPQYDQKYGELTGPLQVVQIVNLTENVPTQQEMDALVGKTGKQLFDDGWYNSGWNLETMEFYMTHGAYSYIIVFDGTVTDYESFEDKDIEKLVVKSVAFDGIGNPTYLPEFPE